MAGGWKHGPAKGASKWPFVRKPPQGASPHGEGHGWSAWGKRKRRPRTLSNEDKRRIAELARGYNGEVVETWVEIMRDPTAPAMARIAAAEKLADRSEGKAVQPIIDGDDLARMTEQEIDAELARLEAAAGEAAAPAAPAARARQPRGVVN
jgi:hypothetical protein